MWNGDDFNEHGEAVRLYQPILYGKKPAQQDLTCSFIGGSSVTPVRCSSCGDPLHLLVQLYVPSLTHQTSSSFNKNRTLQIFCCNRAACTEALFLPKKKGRLVDGSGVVVCKRYVTEENQVTERKEQVKVDDWNTPDDNDWNVVAGADEDEMQSLEAKLAEMETNQTKPKAAVAVEKTVHDDRPIISNNSFPCFSIHSQQEPPAMRIIEDEDDVGMTGSDDKIQKMLEKYMMEEDDEEILTALRGSTGSSRGAGGKGEKDERLSAADRALLTFSDRLKRAPRQVLRYAYDGVPLWSIPVQSPSDETKHFKQRAKAKKKVATQITMEPSIPPCSCGTPRVFEAQVLPSLLHVLEVDKTSLSQSDDLGSLYDNGMNWGNVCIYSCPKSCNQSDSEFVLVQESVDEKPAELKKVMQDVVIEEDSKFEDEDDDDNDEGGDESDDEMDDEE